MRPLPPVVAALALLALAPGCQCGPDDGGPGDDVEAPDAGRRRPDAGQVVVLYPDASVPTAPVFAGEDCPEEAFGDEPAGESADGGLRYGLCVALTTLSGEALLNGAPAKDNINLRFVGGGFGSEVNRMPGPTGHYEVRVMRSRYDLFKYWPGGVFPTFEGYEDFGAIDMTKDQERQLSVASHRLRGSARFGGVPFTPNRFPQDVWFQANGVPQGQVVSVMSQAGAYELSLLAGSFMLYLSTPPVSLFGTELLNYPVVSGNLDFDRDRELDIDIPSALFEGELTVDGQPLPDRKVGEDFQLAFTRPGDLEASVLTHHEGGLAAFAALVPRGRYGVQLRFDGVPDASLPAMMWNKPLTPLMDLSGDARRSFDLTTVALESGLLIDGQPVRPNPHYNLELYLFGRGNASEASSFLMYRVPLVNSSFNLRTFTGLYFAVLRIDQGLGADLAEGFYVIDKQLEVYGDRVMPISINTGLFAGHLTIDGQVPAPGQRAGWLSFRNRAEEGEYSWYRAGVSVGEDGAFQVRLPRGDYEVYFTVDPVTFPDYASGLQLMLSRVHLEERVDEELAYRTVAVTGPLRVGSREVEDTIGGPEVGLVLHRSSDFYRDWEWYFEGGRPDYTLRVPVGDYSMQFLINERAIDGVAFGTAPMGRRLLVGVPSP